MEPTKMNIDLENRVETFLTVLNNYDSPFTYEEVMQYEEGFDLALQNGLKNDNRFFIVQIETNKSSIIFPKKYLFFQLINLNFRLARADKCKLAKRELQFMINSFNHKLNNAYISREIIEFGKTFGLISVAYETDKYIFPLAYILRLITSDIQQDIICCIMEIYQEYIDGKTFNNLSNAFLNDGFGAFSPRIKTVVQSREGLNCSHKFTLEEIGSTMGVTRERTRQLENRFWKVLSEKQSRRLPFIKAFICDFLSNGGSLLVQIEKDHFRYRQFLAKCLDIPALQLTHSTDIILGIKHLNEPKLELPKQGSNKTEIGLMIQQLDKVNDLCIYNEDLLRIAKNMIDFQHKHLTVAERLYLTLKALGRPAHSSIISEFHDKNFPDMPCNENHVHSALCREEMGIVWIGMKGIFALREWGYEHPPKNLTEVIAEIVIKKYKDTSLPVSLEVIRAEIGKYRKTVNQNSLVLAAYYNPLIKHVKRNLFVPTDSSSQISSEMDEDELDKILNQFGNKNVYK
jgi:hypothetical protein